MGTIISTLLLTEATGITVLPPTREWSGPQLKGVSGSVVSTCAGPVHSRSESKEQFLLCLSQKQLQSLSEERETSDVQ